MVLDARGLRCPWPVLRAARELRSETAVEILADDPAAPRELALFASANELAFEEVESQRFKLVKPPQ